MKRNLKLGLLLTVFLISVVSGITLFSSTRTSLKKTSVVSNELELTDETERYNNDEIKAEMVVITPEVEIVFDLEVDVGCEIGLGNDKGKTSPSEQWQYCLKFTDNNGMYDTVAEEIKDLDIIMSKLVEEWIENNVKNEGRKKKMLERYVIIDYEYNITEWPVEPM